ncbi:methyltransferase domain-containing protein [Streptomyces sp. NPDC086554]|uniref:bifunctional class I SAM-dependent methyltransferase/NUDIX hydrolase n=1 Tax=Streptomyces sp. NPDC086554 TaxID=3154864 RepID=UPI00342051A5
MTIDWDAEAATFDDEPDHGLRDVVVREAWAGRLRDWLPETAGDVLDLGCGTGSLSLIAAESGHRVTAVDLSPRMTERAREKLAGHGAEVLLGDAASPPVGGRRFDVVLARHVLWMLPDPEATLRHWCSLLRPGGRLILIEGVWGTTSPSGIPAPPPDRGTDTPGGPPALGAPLGRRTPLGQRGGGRAVRDRRRPPGAPAPPQGGGRRPPRPPPWRRGVIREAREEIGLTLTPEDVRATVVRQHRGPGGNPRIGWFFEANHGRGMAVGGAVAAALAGGRRRGGA